MLTFPTRTLLCALVLILASCGTYHVNPPGGVSANAVIRGSSRTGDEAGLRQGCAIAMVDGLQADYRRRESEDRRFQLAPGTHRVLVMVGSYSSLLSVPYEAWVELDVKVRANRVYQVEGYTDGGEFVIWVEDRSTGEIVTGKKRVPLQLSSGYGLTRLPPQFQAR